jgi:uncharacterized protein (TIGR00266 family)
MAGYQQWYYVLDGKQAGPISVEDLNQKIREGSILGTTLVFGPGMTDWKQAAGIDSLKGLFTASVQPAAAPPGRSRIAEEIDYKIFGDDMQFVEVELDPGESAVSEAGAMMYMTPGIQMNTVFGDGSATSAGGGFMDKLLGAGKRLLTGEGLFMTVFSNAGSGKQQVAFAAPYAGKIIPIDLKTQGGQLICQKDALLCAARGVSIGIVFQRKIGVGLFGGEGFIMEKLDGDGLCFIHAGGTIHTMELAAGQTLRVDTGCLVALQPSVNYDIQFVGGVKTALFGGEGLFFATLTGPGRVWLQSLPLSRLADRIYKAMPGVGRGGKEEGSILGGMGLGGIIGGNG